MDNPVYGIRDMTEDLNEAPCSVHCIASNLVDKQTEAFEVLLADGVSRSSGRPGEWLVDYGDGSLGIVSQPIFATTYEIID